MPPTFLWPAEDGWPYPDSAPEIVDLDADVDDDLLSLTSPSTHVFDDLEPLERRVITSVYGLGGQPVLSFEQLRHQLGVPDVDLRNALGSGLGKLRTHLA
jgi:DNA-directed RNA polymerase sigma subunit (sigma70/sigma32)